MVSKTSAWAWQTAELHVEFIHNYMVLSGLQAGLSNSLCLHESLVAGPESADGGVAVSLEAHEVHVQQEGHERTQGQICT